METMLLKYSRQQHFKLFKETSSFGTGRRMKCFCNCSEQCNGYDYSTASREGDRPNGGLTVPENDGRGGRIRLGSYASNERLPVKKRGRDKGDAKASTASVNGDELAGKQFVDGTTA
ncbi:Hypothetical predicted protein [Olea europaea subsp. europaea]|uniref:Uncharacterized protein n=1 Tax=Olea europaea subsp. europaea TaxID=158383 RepID=A0A8S0RB85_OLEEU|nr:Hypothetical predicted protein [Olea europaea subsp. europaea]